MVETGDDYLPYHQATLLYAVKVVLVHLINKYLSGTSSITVLDAKRHKSDHLYAQR